MGYHAFSGYDKSELPRYVVTWDLQWNVIDWHRVEPGANLHEAILAAIDQAKAKGWVAEAEPVFGFVFIRSGESRRLLAITPRDPNDDRPQSFNPYL